MPAILVWLLGGLATMLQSLIPRILFTLGIGFATFTGVDLALEALGDAIEGRLLALPSQVREVLGVLQVDTGITLVLSAWLATVALRMTTGALTRVTMKGTL